MLSVLLIIYFIYIAKKKFTSSGLVLLITIAMCFFSLDAFSYIGFIMIAMALISMRKEDKVEGENENVNT